MGEERGKSGYASGEPASPYSDAYYVPAPQAGRTCYGYNVAQCYARASEEPAPSAPEKKKRRAVRWAIAAGLICLAAILLWCVLAPGVSDESPEAAVDSSARVLFEGLAGSGEEGGTARFRTAPAAGRRTLDAEEIYAVACRSTVGVTAPGYGQNGTAQTGTGIVLSEDGYILTNYGVIGEAYQNGAALMVVTPEGEEYPAEVLGVETDSDLALLRIEAEDLVPAELGDADALRVGEVIYAVGNPLGELTYTMTRGIVSALDCCAAGETDEDLALFQIDAAVGRGAAGGPVFNGCGQVVGMICTRYTGEEGMGFVVPMDKASRAASELAEQGYVSGKTYLGLTMAAVSPSVAQYYGLVQGVFIYSVEPGSCMDRAGLAAGDIITAVDGQPVTSRGELVRAVRGYSAGDAAELTVCREEYMLTMRVEFDEEERPADRTREGEGKSPPSSGEPSSGEIVLSRE